MLGTWSSTQLFQSTPSAWRETAAAFFSNIKGIYFNPLPPHGGRRNCFLCQCCYINISIHSLRMEGDMSFLGNPAIVTYFNPLPPHGGRRLDLAHPTTINRHFNPLPPHGGRLYNRSYHQRQPYFNPLPPHGGRHTLATICQRNLCISIHSLRMEGDTGKKSEESSGKLFQSTPSAWRET